MCLKRTSPRPDQQGPIRLRSIWRVVLLLGALIQVSAIDGREEPIHREWRQRIAQTSRRFLQQNVANPFVPPDRSVAPIDGAGEPSRETTRGSLSGRLIQSSTVGNASSQATTKPSPGVTGPIEGRGLADWDWRERFQWFQTWGAGPVTSNATESAEGSARLEASTSSYWWFQNPFKSP